MPESDVSLLNEFAKTSPLDAHARVQKGIPLSEVVRFAKTLDLTQEEVASILGLHMRTYQRWLVESAKKLDSLTGGRYYRTLKVVQRAILLLGTPQASLTWLRSPQRALGQRVPFELLSTDPGAEAVEDLLGRIEHGVVT
jgi:putative toxin-antitoxin system antitoxin component (TIGR02293 family)